MKQDRAMDDAKRAHFKPKTAQQEQIMKLQDEIKELQEWNAATKAENQKIRIENLNLKEKLIDYQRLMRAMRAIESMEAWFDEDDE